MNGSRVKKSVFVCSLVGFVDAYVRVHDNLQRSIKYSRNIASSPFKSRGKVVTNVKGASPFRT